MLGSAPNFQAFWWAVHPEDSVIIRFRLEYPQECFPYKVKVTLTGCIGYAALHPYMQGVGFDNGEPFCSGGLDPATLEPLNETNIRRRDPLTGELKPASISQTVELDCPDPCDPNCPPSGSSDMSSM
jgi:hypothetical protein